MPTGLAKTISVRASRTCSSSWKRMRPSKVALRLQRPRPITHHISVMCRILKCVDTLHHHSPPALIICNLIVSIDVYLPLLVCSPDRFESIDSKTKAALTRLYNSSEHKSQVCSNPCLRSHHNHKAQHSKP